VFALIYAILMSAFFDFFTLSPALMSGIFQLVIINGIFQHIAVKAKDEQFLNMGMVLGLSALFYLPTLIYLPVSILALGLYSSMNFKKYILLLFGFLFPIILVGIFFFWNGALVEFINYYFLSWLAMSFRELVNLKTLLFISIPGFLLLIFSWLKIYTVGRYNNHQTNYMLIMILFLAAAFIMVFMSCERVPYQLMIFVIFVVFYLGYLFFLIKRKILSEVFFLAFFTIIILVNYGVLYRFVVLSGIFEYERLFVTSILWD